MTAEKSGHPGPAAAREMRRASVSRRLGGWWRRVAALMDDREALIAFFKSLR
jgi:hypothetical protein